eukprot:snap_masked-scaffold_71-processed-gene-0.20-mRNA-1 protein AED:1.00 eAED:1.00 QI:0/-1/0/0/-1/1/1/0/68
MNSFKLRKKILGTNPFVKALVDIEVIKESIQLKIFCCSREELENAKLKHPTAYNERKVVDEVIEKLWN